MTIRQEKFIRFRCPHCGDYGQGRTFSKFIKCGSKWCERGFCWIRHQVSEKEWYRLHPRDLEWEAKFDAYYAEWLKKDREKHPCR